MDITLEGTDLEGALQHPLVQALLHHTSDGAVLIDFASRRIRHMNPRARELLGFPEGAAGEHKCHEVMDSPVCREACMLTNLVEGRNEDGEVRLYYRPAESRDPVHASARVILVRDQAGTPLLGIELFRDLTEVVRLERALGVRRDVHGIIGSSAAIAELCDLVEQVAPYELPVLITGESGVGKERFADAIQHLSDRADKPYLKVNCAALNPALIESELFGHRRGAFTGASQDRRGRFEEAHTGTLLLDEVGELPLGLQAKLLRVLQHGEIQRVGEDRPRIVDVRVLAATNRDVEADVQAGHFREDLYYRLAGVRLDVPPLRTRRQDVPLLAEHFLAAFSNESELRGRPKPAPPLTSETIHALTENPWRGNVRELQNVLRLAFIRSPAGQPLRPSFLQVPGTKPAPHRASGSSNLAELERQAIQQAMDSSDGNVAAAARVLGIDRSTLWRKLKKAQL